MTARIGIVLMGVCLILYFIVAGQQAFLFMGTGEPIAIAMGVAAIVLPLIGVWALIREIQFGVSADRLGRRLDAEGGMPEAETELTARGKIAEADAEGIVTRYRAAAESAPEEWRAHYRLGVVQDAAGRRKDARASIREAIRVEKQTR
ncbi:hypothetical protein OED01_06485 [Microbacterium sp. M28]|uniref:hypothetical protein n=1 Tax=Microbacterium sp. M28 TaxID=2962064 RepID=UPI0021F4D9A6|nr:hypothetical protein [Microbacterium sp. M28]UYO98354.1 hypothetical protein OED01_06485 [Microbacterium sp. M28]